MSEFRLRTDLERAVIGGFALPLGIEPGEIEAPVQGYTLTYTQGQEDEPDTYTFQVVASHERLAPLVRRTFEFLPEEVWPIIEIDSADAYRMVDVYLGREEEPVSSEEFLETWATFEPIFLEDGGIGVGANSEEPFIEIFLDQWKVISIHVPLDMRDEIEAMLHEFDLEEVPQTWPQPDPDKPNESIIRPVFTVNGNETAGLDELLLELRHLWRLELNIDPDRNLDEGGRELGITLWQAVVVVEDASGDPDKGAFITVWASAKSLAQMEHLIEGVLAERPEWSFSETYSINRVAFDERPEDLSDLPPRRTRAAVHLVTVEPWQQSPQEHHDA
jgi:hypothetical protein